jgi:hypothetical protein
VVVGLFAVPDHIMMNDWAIFPGTTTEASQQAPVLLERPGVFVFQQSIGSCESGAWTAGIKCAMISIRLDLGQIWSSVDGIQRFVRI